MKKVFFSIFLLVINLCYAQDTLIFNNGNIEVVEVTAFDKLRGLIVYKQDDNNIYIGLNELKDYKIHSSINNLLPGEISKFSKEDKVVKSTKYTYFERPSKYNYGKYAVSTNLTSLFSFSDSRGNTVYAHNRVFSIEPEYFYSEKISIKMPVMFGLQRSLEAAEENELYGKTWHYNYWNDGIPPQLNTEYLYEQYDEDHPRDIIFQIGIYPKYYSNGQTKNAFYLSTGFNFGVADFYAINYYHKFNDYGDYTETKELRNNPTIFFRHEGLVGVTFNISESICFAYEAGYSTRINNRGKEEDHVYRKLYGENNTLIYSDIYTFEGASWHIVNRFHLVLRF